MSGRPNVNDKIVAVKAYLTDETFGYEHWRAAQFSAPKYDRHGALLLFDTPDERDAFVKNFGAADPGGPREPSREAVEAARVVYHGPGAAPIGSWETRLFITAMLRAAYAVDFRAGDVPADGGGATELFPGAPVLDAAFDGPAPKECTCGRDDQVPGHDVNCPKAYRGTL
jgi:hypothetical protein